MKSLLVVSALSLASAGAFAASKDAAGVPVPSLGIFASSPESGASFEEQSGGKTMINPVALPPVSDAPEPGTYALFAAGAVIVAGALRRRSAR